MATSTADSDGSQTAAPGTYGVAPAGHRLPDATRIRTVTLQVSELHTSRDFYQRILGFHATELAPNRVSLSDVDGGAPLIELIENRAGHPLTRKTLGLFHVAILLPSRVELGRFLAHVQAAGARVGAGDHFVSEALYVQDPDDLGIEVYADRPRETWLRNGRELVMGTDPLDRRGLVAAGADQPWRGMPAGTTIGHVHLHVGDLEEAGRFYGDAIGFDRMVWSYSGALFLAAGGYHHHLGTNVWAGPGARPAAPDDPQLLEWKLELPAESDLQAVGASLREFGYPAGGSADALLTRDPWGTSLRLVTPR
ncbi:MAG: VOC family protein [Gemmatimonadota bacterium]